MRSIKIFCTLLSCLLAGTLMSACGYENSSSGGAPPRKAMDNNQKAMDNKESVDRNQKDRNRNRICTDHPNSNGCENGNGQERLTHSDDSFSHNHTEEGLCGCQTGEIPVVFYNTREASDQWGTENTFHWSHDVREFSDHHCIDSHQSQIGIKMRFRFDSNYQNQKRRNIQGTPIHMEPLGQSSQFYSSTGSSDKNCSQYVLMGCHPGQANHCIFSDNQGQKRHGDCEYIPGKDYGYCIDS